MIIKKGFCRFYLQVLDCEILSDFNYSTGLNVTVIGRVVIFGLFIQAKDSAWLQGCS